MVTSDFRLEVEIRPFCARMRNASGHNYWNSSFIIEVAMGQIPRSTERILVMTIFIPSGVKIPRIKIKVRNNCYSYYYYLWPTSAKPQA